MKILMFSWLFIDEEISKVRVVGKFFFGFLKQKMLERTAQD